MRAQKFTIGTQFVVYCTRHDTARKGYVAQDLIVIDTKTNAITGKFCDRLEGDKTAEERLDNVLAYYWIEAQGGEPGCVVKEVK
jgi:hypothetical protein